MNTILRIHIVSDVVCPWCVVGYRQLHKALQNFHDVDTLIQWHPFELNPQMPEGGMNLNQHLAEKYGATIEDSVRIRQQLISIGQELGFSFHYSNEMKIYNTLKAHQLLHYAREFDQEHALKLRLFSDYFSEGKSIDNDDVLLQSASSCSLSVEDCKQVLETQKFALEVRQEIASIQNQGIHAVPAFIFEQKHLVVGAQGVEVFKQTIDKILNTKE